MTIWERIKSWHLRRETKLRLPIALMKGDQAEMYVDGVLRRYVHRNEGTVVIRTAAHFVAISQPVEKTS